jgi:hypothetical protein
MSQTDFFDAPTQAKREFKDIRGTRPTVAEEKAALSLQLNRLCQSPPDSVRNGSINVVRSWVEAQKKALKTLKSARSSVQELTSAISNMRGFI